jgi:diaminopimelate decarboxylase
VSELAQRAPGFVYGPGTPRTGKALLCEKVALKRLAQRFGTPLYVYSARAIRERVIAFDQAFRHIEHTICYSVKANSNLRILRLLAELGCGFDVVSGGELERVLRANRGTRKRVVFSGVGKTAAEMKAALRAGILLFNLESASELDTLSACAAQLKRTARIAFRVNPDVSADTHPYISTGLQEHKFGVPWMNAPKLYARAAKSKYLRVAGVSVHIGSQITGVEPFSSAVERVAELIAQLRRDGHEIQYVDAGGGLGINYSKQAEDFKTRVAEYARAIVRPLRALGVKVVLEPGRAIVGPAGVLLTRVLYRKMNDEKKFVVVDAGMNDLIRPSLYQAEHQIVPVQLSDAAGEIADIVGPVCESGDFFARDRKIPAVREGELLAILDAGAYGMVLSSNYNSRPRPAEVLVDGRSATMIRKRETAADLMRAELTSLSEN